MPVPIFVPLFLSPIFLLPIKHICHRITFRALPCFKIDIELYQNKKAESNDSAFKCQLMSTGSEVVSVGLQSPKSRV